MKAAVRELIRCVEEFGIRNIKLTGECGDCDLDHRDMWPLYEVADHHRIPILVHPAARAAWQSFAAAADRRRR